MHNIIQVIMTLFVCFTKINLLIFLLVCYSISIRWSYFLVSVTNCGVGVAIVKQNQCAMLTNRIDNYVENCCAHTLLCLPTVARHITALINYTVLKSHDQTWKE